MTQSTSQRNAASAPAAISGPSLGVIDKGSYVVGRLDARVGLHTHAGVISRVSAKSI